MTPLNTDYKRVSIVIPVFNEENTIQALLSAVKEAPLQGLEKEIIVVNDGSTDNTGSLLKKISHITVITLPNNSGKGAALKVGFAKTTGHIVLVQDADLEYSPSDYPKLVEPILKNNADVVYGSRFISDGPRRVLYFWHSVANFFVTLFSNMCTNLNLTDIETGYKVFRGDLIRTICPQLTSNRFGFEPEITARISRVPGIVIYEVGIRYQGRTYDEGKKITAWDGVVALWLIMYFRFFERAKNSS